jgi:uncharacterized membrane protein YccF (DUF307 family)
MIRWWQSKTYWVNMLAGLVNALTALSLMLTTIDPILIYELLTAIGMSPTKLATVTAIVNIAVNLANVWLRQISVRPVGNKAQVAAFTDFTDRVINDDERVI